MALMLTSSSPARADRYVYQPLDHTRNQIRLIHLKILSEYEDPATSGPIECTMEVFDLDKALPFTALSYTWGPPAPAHHILVDGKPFTIRENLFQFLQEFRTTEPDPDNGSDQWLWIDQIVIDQGNATERNQQVQMMSDIYHGAESVIVWLGIGDSRATFYEGTPDPRTMYETAKDYRETKDTSTLGVILRNDYFSRVWVVQEFLLAKRVRILVKDVWLFSSVDVGEDVLSALYENRVRGVHGVNFFFKRYRSDHMASTLRLSFIDSLFSIRHTRSDNMASTTGFSFPDALISFRHTACEDPRDNVYGFLALVEYEERVVVDYKKLPQQVLMDAVSIVLSSVQYVKDPLSRPVVLNKQDLENEICTLARRMGCTPSQLSSLSVLLRALWTPERLDLFRGHPCPINDMGFDPANGVDIRVDRWWFAFLEER
jgi:hypothetical protein